MVSSVPASTVMLFSLGEAAVKAVSPTVAVGLSGRLSSMVMRRSTVRVSVVPSTVKVISVRPGSRAEASSTAFPSSSVTALAPTAASRGLATSADTVTPLRYCPLLSFTRTVTWGVLPAFMATTVS